jgi:hypothetical protein
MAEHADKESPLASQARVQPFLDCVSCLLAKRWLHDQRQHEEHPPHQDKTDVPADGAGP